MRILKNKKGISTILAALLLVVIAIAAGIIVYSWATGLLGGLMGEAPSVGEIMTMDAYGWDSGSGNCTLYLRNSGDVTITIDAVYSEGIPLTLGADFSCQVSGSDSLDIDLDEVGALMVGSAHFATGENEIRVVTQLGNTFNFKVVK